MVLLRQGCHKSGYLGQVFEAEKSAIFDNTLYPM